MSHDNKLPKETTSSSWHPVSQSKGRYVGIASFSRATDKSGCSGRKQCLSRQGDNQAGIKTIDSVGPQLPNGINRFKTTQRCHPTSYSGSRSPRPGYLNTPFKDAVNLSHHPLLPLLAWRKCQVQCSQPVEMRIAIVLTLGLHIHYGILLPAVPSPPRRSICIPASTSPLTAHPSIATATSWHPKTSPSPFYSAPTRAWWSCTRQARFVKPELLARFFIMFKWPCVLSLLLSRQYPSTIRSSRS